MNESRTSLSNASSYSEAGEYWDQHDLSEVWDRTHEVEMEVNIPPTITYACRKAPFETEEET